MYFFAIQTPCHILQLMEDALYSLLQKPDSLSSFAVATSVHPSLHRSTDKRMLMGHFHATLVSVFFSYVWIP